MEVLLSSVIPYTHFNVQFLEKFGVTVRREDETLTLKCMILVMPDLKMVQPRAEWYQDGDVQILGPLSNMHALEISRTYLVLSWDLPTPLSKKSLMYFI
ncbi:Myomesin-2 [Sciurus carolinensis]|uniref:Myomesin-2 n=1 Tax=Sciurus carolinensis TaxID=30640 RepID=A0AA41T350_SCICA|nr:Myomesin-2 [Sciurus carolinensis]